MLFTEPVFLFLFLPVTLLLYALCPPRFRNLLLAAASLLFYAWGELGFVPLLLFSVALNYLLALWIERTRETPAGRGILALGIAADLSLLVFFKYANFFADNVNDVFTFYAGIAPLNLDAIALPLGISFFTFHKISYKVDVYRGVVPASRSPVDLAMYILLFPQLIAGPIIRYHEIAGQIARRRTTPAGFAEGIRRFTVGFGKKMILANTAAQAADAIFVAPAPHLSPSVAWLGLACYTLQIYFDFSGYSDMAIGLGRMFGFRFPENFDYPYVSGSVTEFWRRWHLSLSRWFRDYLYVPLGGNRVSRRRLYANLFTVFFFCGLWHGASWNFIVWGLYHGAFLAMERAGLGRRLEGLGPLRHVYALGVVTIGWVFFRVETMPNALGFLGALVNFGGKVGPDYPLALYWNNGLALALAAGVLGATPLPSAAFARLEAALSGSGVRAGWEYLAGGLELAFLGGVFFLSVMRVAAGTYNPFIYFRF